MSKQQHASPLQSLLDQKIRHFVGAFLESSRLLFADSAGKLVHAGEFGTYREGITKQFLQAFVPQRMTIDSGFVINPSGKISTQCDLVIYDQSATPLLQNEQLQRFFPAESVCAVGEVKSVMSRAELEIALRKLASIKTMRDSLWKPAYLHSVKEEGRQSKFQPQIDERDHFLTFLICESFSFDFHSEAKRIFACYEAENPKYPHCLRHNFILSLKDGLATYFHPEADVLFHAPTKATEIFEPEEDQSPRMIRIGAKRMKNRWICPQPGSMEHIRQFAKLLYLGLSTTSVFIPEISKYLISQEDVFFADYEL